MKCEKCGHRHQGVFCGYPIKWASNNVPREICYCKKDEVQDK